MMEYCASGLTRQTSAPLLRWHARTSTRAITPRVDALRHERAAGSGLRCRSNRSACDSVGNSIDTSIDHGRYANPAGRHHAESSNTITFAEVARRYKLDEVSGLGAYQGRDGRWVRPGHERDQHESMLPMTAVLERVWGQYLITSMATALPAEAEEYLKEVKTAQAKTPYAWKSNTIWNRYRERASALFKFAEKHRLIPYGSNPFLVGRVREFVEFEQEVPSRRIPPSKQRELLAACDARWADSKRFPHQADIMRDRLQVLFGTSIRTGEMLAIQREHCAFVTEEGVETAKLFKLKGGNRVMVRVCVPPEQTKGGKRTGKGFTRYVAAASAVEVFRRKMKQFEERPKAFLFGTNTGVRVTTFRKAAIELFRIVGLKFGRGRGQYRIHDARHATKTFSTRRPWRRPERYRRWDSMLKRGSQLWTI